MKWHPLASQRTTCISCERLLKEKYAVNWLSPCSLVKARCLRILAKLINNGYIIKLITINLHHRTHERMKWVSREQSSSSQMTDCCTVFICVSFLSVYVFTLSAGGGITRKTLIHESLPGNHTHRSGHTPWLKYSTVKVKYCRGTFLYNSRSQLISGLPFSKFLIHTLSLSGPGLHSPVAEASWF